MRFADDEVCRDCGYLFLECECPDTVQNCRAACPEHTSPEIPPVEEVPEGQLMLFLARPAPCGPDCAGKRRCAQCNRTGR